MRPQDKRAVALVNQFASVNVSRQVLLFPLSVAAISDRYPSGSQLIDLNALFIDHNVGEEVERIELIVNFVDWISQSDFLRLQQPEPMVGDPPRNLLRPFPGSLEAQGIRGLSIYTALFHHLDMQRFTCKICGHIVNDRLEDAITHQRATHFHHYPYRCPQAQWYVYFLLSRRPISRSHFHSACCPSQTKPHWKHTSSPLRTR